MVLQVQYIFLSSLFTICAGQVSNYEYSIQVPKFPCFPNKTQEATTIRVTGKDAQKLSYEWKVNFKTNSTCLQQQRCTLLIWKSVRNVEKSFVNKTTEIKINNSLLMPTVQYLLNVTVRANTTFVGTKEFILECTNSSTFSEGGSAPPEKLNNDPHINLFGSNVTYRDMTYILNAEAANCVENNSYYYKWELLDQFQNIVESDFHKGSILKFKSKMLDAETEYLIRCSIIDSKYSSVIAMATQNLRVLSKGMVLMFTVRKLSVGLNKPFKLSAYFQDDDYPIDQVEIKWSCTYEKNRPCVNFKSLNSTVLDGITLPNIGIHNFSITVTRKNAKASDFCEVKTIPDAYATIEIDDIDVPVDPSKEIVVPAYINSLVTGCTLQWKSLSLKQYGYVDLNKLPGNVDALTNITIMEDEFLNEIDEYTNNTIDKEYNLIIPKPDGKWLGVKGNSSYLFRLNVTCPDLKDVADSLDSIEELLALNPITLTADVLIFTDNPPVMNSLHVNPLNGTALKTYFSFYTKLIDNESPMLYKFGYVLNNQTVFVESMLGVERCRSLLPFIGTGVKTVLEVCNANGLCSQIIGPTVSTTVPILSDDDKNYFLMELNELIKREEYYKVFVHAVAISETYDNMKDVNSSKSFGTFINNLIISEIKRLLKSNQEEERWIISANNLIKDVGILLNKISASDELLNNIIALRNRVSNKKDYTSLVEEVEPQYFVRKLLSVDRVKRNAEKITLEEVKSYLVISELIITTSNDKKRVQQEKQHLLNQVDKFMTQLCGTLHEKPQTMNLDLKTMSLSVEKLNKNNANRYFHILHDTNAWKINGRIKLGKCFIENLTFTNQLCLGKALFKNYLDKDDFVYMVKVYVTKSQEQPKLQNMLCEAVLVLPVDVEKVVKKEPKCTLWKDSWQQSQCKTLQVASKAVQCQCKYLGYYSLEYEDVVPVTTQTPFSTSPLSSTIVSSTSKFNPTTELTTVAALSTPSKSTTLITTLILPTKTTENTVFTSKPKTTPFETFTTIKIDSHVSSTSSTKTEEVF